MRGHVSANVRLAGKGRGGLTVAVIVMVTAQIHLKKLLQPKRRAISLTGKARYLFLLSQ